MSVITVRSPLYFLYEIESSLYHMTAFLLLLIMIWSHSPNLGSKMHLYYIQCLLSYSMQYQHMFFIKKKKAGLKGSTLLCFIHNANFLSVKNETKWCTLWHGTQTLPKHSFLSKYQTLPWYTCKCNFIFSHRKSTVLLMPIFTLVIIIQYICVEMCTKFFPHIG